jgi:hypothetical protein
MGNPPLTAAGLVVAVVSGGVGSAASTPLRGDPHPDRSDGDEDEHEADEGLEHWPRIALFLRTS